MTKDEIKSLIEKTIIENNNGEITADKLRGVLLEMVNETPIQLILEMEEPLVSFSTEDVPDSCEEIYKAYKSGLLNELCGHFVLGPSGKRYLVERASMSGYIDADFYVPSENVNDAYTFTKVVEFGLGFEDTELVDGPYISVLESFFVAFTDETGFIFQCDV